MTDQNKYIVAAEVGTKYKGCLVTPQDAIIIATHRKVFGPDTKQNCEQWKKRNCK